LAVPNIGVAAPTIVYDNTTTPVTGSWTPDGFWPFSYYAPNEPTGDEITLLAGTDREIVEFHLVLSSTQQVNLGSLTLAFYENDGLDGYGHAGAPGTLLWATTASNVVVNGTAPVVFSVPNVVVPDTFTWIASADSMSAGLVTYDPPTVGLSDVYFWDRDSVDLNWYALTFDADPPATGYDPVANFGAKVYAVPEPGALVLVILGGLAAAWKNRRGPRLRR
jgi:hypothetical protein